MRRRRVNPDGARSATRSGRGRRPGVLPGRPAFGADDLRLPDELRGPLHAHLTALRSRYRARGWGTRVGFGQRPALLVIDLAIFWTDPRNTQMGSPVDSVVRAACRLLAAARASKAPVFFTTYAYDRTDPPSPHDGKLRLRVGRRGEALFALDPRLRRRPGEPLVRKKYASAFKATNLHEMLTGLGVDTLVVAGVSTSHCVYATCRDATDSFRVIVPREAVGERCELLHEVNLFDIDVDLGDVVPVAQVARHLRESAWRRRGSSRRVAR
jgi:maleamate amidohydrolase